MPYYYADSSVLVRRHATERGTLLFEALTQQSNKNIIITSQISTVEVVSAFQRKQREGLLSVSQAMQLSTDFLALCSNDYSLIDVTVNVLDHARTLLQQYPLRAYDAVQLASALEVSVVLQIAGLQPFVFLSADRQLLRAAESVRLLVDNPNLYP